MLTSSLCWLIALIVFLIVEALTVGLVSIWFAAGSLVALLVSLAVDNIWIQFAVFFVVTEPIDNLNATGAVQLEGKVWTARSVDGSLIPVDAKVKVERIEGVKVLVRPVQSVAAGQDMSQT